MKVCDVAVSTESAFGGSTALVTASLQLEQESARATVIVSFSQVAHFSAYLAAGSVRVADRTVVGAKVICETRRRGGWTAINGPFLDLEPRRPREPSQPQTDSVSCGPVAKAFLRDVVQGAIVAWIDEREDIRTLIEHRAAAEAVARQRADVQGTVHLLRRQYQRLADAEAEYLAIVGHPAPSDSGRTAVGMIVRDPASMLRPPTRPGEQSTVQLAML
jgi:hypothetical protein